tara:strand:+ start:507 stop:656 length:150 start_codon:yes stop_codon:yes gene_type:complete
MKYAALILLLTACGIKGPLVRPADMAKEEKDPVESSKGMMPEIVRPSDM